MSVDELTTNLKCLIKQAMVKDTTSNEEQHIIVGKRVKHRFQEKSGNETEFKWYTERIISQMHISAICSRIFPYLQKLAYFKIFNEFIKLLLKDVFFSILAIDEYVFVAKFGTFCMFALIKSCK